MTILTALIETRFFSQGIANDAVLRNVAIPGEAAKGIREHIKEQHCEVEWRKIAGFSDVPAHSYLRLEEETLWDVVTYK